jgi:cytochrome c-type biogenesis protein CcmH
VILFSLVCLWLIGATFGFVFLPSRGSGHSGSGHTTTGANVDIYRDQLAELQSELRDGRIAQERFLRARHELEQRLAADLRPVPSPGATSGHATRPAMTMYWLGTLVSLGAVLLYLAIGAPSLLWQTR